MHESHVEHVASLLHAIISLQQLIATHWSHFFVLDVAQPTVVPPHVPLHTFEQHSKSLEHETPSGSHGGGGGGGDMQTPLHMFEQHCAAAVHGEPRLAHGGGAVSGCVMTSLFASGPAST